MNRGPYKSCVVRQRLIAAGTGKDDNPEVRRVEEPFHDGPTLCRGDHRIVHVNGQEYQQLLVTLMTKKVENSPAHLLRYARLDLHRDVATDDAVNSSRPTSPVVDVHGWAGVHESGAHSLLQDVLPVLVMTCHPARRGQGRSSRNWPDTLRWHGGPEDGLEEAPGPDASAYPTGGCRRR